MKVPSGTPDDFGIVLKFCLGNKKATFVKGGLLVKILSSR
jgi:hypothetical protein